MLECPGGEIIPNALSSSQFAVDTIVLSLPNAKSISSLKLLLYCFELSHGLKINFAKSSVTLTYDSTNQGPLVPLA